jgi:hypothetical protein
MLLYVVFCTPYFSTSHIDYMLLYVVFSTPYFIASHIDFMLLYVVFCTPYFIASHIDSMLLYVIFLKMTSNASRSSFILCISVFCHNNIFLLTGFCLCALHAMPNRAMTWSLFSIDGRGLYRCLKVGCDVSITFNVFYLLVGKSTICSSRLSATISRNAWFVLWIYSFLVMVCSFQLISGKLKSSSIKNTSSM